MEEPAGGKEHARTSLLQCFRYLKGSKRQQFIYSILNEENNLPSEMQAPINDPTYHKAL